LEANKMTVMNDFGTGAYLAEPEVARGNKRE